MEVSARLFVHNERVVEVASTAPKGLMQSNSGNGPLTEQSRAFQLAESRAARMIHQVFDSGRPLMYIRSAEENRVTRVLREVGLGLLASGPVPVWTWSLTEGMNRCGQPSEDGTETARGALDF